MLVNKTLIICTYCSLAQRRDILMIKNGTSFTKKQIRYCKECHKYTIKNPKRKKYRLDEQVDIVSKLHLYSWKDSLKYREVAINYGINVSTLYRWALKHKQRKIDVSTANFKKSRVYKYWSYTTFSKYSLV